MLRTVNTMMIESINDLQEHRFLGIGGGRPQLQLTAM
jgi:hypothetical protein